MISWRTFILTIFAIIISVVGLVLLLVDFESYKGIGSLLFVGGIIMGGFIWAFWKRFEKSEKPSDTWHKKNSYEKS